MPATYTHTFTILLASGYAAASLDAQLKDTAGVNTGGRVTTGFVALGSGAFSWTGAIPEGHRGSVIFREAGQSTVLAVESVNPETMERAAGTPGVSGSGYTESAADIIVTRGVTLRESFTPGVDITGYTDLRLRAVALRDAEDEEAAILVSEDSGLEVLDGAEYATAGHGSLTVTAEGTGATSLQLDEAATALLPVQAGLRYQLLATVAGDVLELDAGTLDIV